MKEIVLDVSELEAPLPLLRAKEVVKQLDKNSYIHMIHRMSPHLLLPFLSKNGYEYKEIKKDSLYHIYICLLGSDMSVEDLI
ncbi:MAG: hypothetical protein ACLFQJ_08970 [Campylobacterales bacterium]